MKKSMQDETFEYLSRVFQNPFKAEYLWSITKESKPYKISATHFQALRCIRDRWNSQYIFGYVHDLTGKLIEV